MSDCSLHCGNAREWARNNFTGTTIRNKRLRKRLEIVARQMALQPGDSIPRLFPNMSAMEACYRLMNHDKLTPQSVQVDHWNRTRQLMDQASGTIALVGDHSTFSWIRHGHIEGLGPVGDNIATSQGFLMHTTMALELLDEQTDCHKVSRCPARILGLAHQELHVRPTLTPEQKKAKAERNAKKGQGRSRAKAVEDEGRLESDLWIEPLRQMGPVAEGKRRIVVNDRESDIYELLVECRTLNYEHCIRASRDRVMVDEQEKLFEQARQCPSLGEVDLELRSRGGRPARKARLSVSVLQDVEIRSPQRPGHAAGSLAPAKLSVVRVWEDNPPPDEERLEWLLLVSGSPRTMEEALFWVRLYALRWVIEEYHKGIKSGLRAEALQLESGKGLMTAVSIMAVVALRLLSMRDLARNYPQMPAKFSGLEKDELQVLSKAAKRELKTVVDVILSVGRLGGHLNRKGDGLPGWMTLWEGMFRLQMMVEGYRLARGS